MKIYIISQVVFTFIFGLLSTLKVFSENNSILDKVLTGIFVLLFLVMGAVQGYLKGFYEIKDRTTTCIFIISALVLLTIVILINVIKHYIGK